MPAVVRAAALEPRPRPRGGGASIGCRPLRFRRCCLRHCFAPMRAGVTQPRCICRRSQLPGTSPCVSRSVTGFAPGGTCVLRVGVCRHLHVGPLIDYPCLSPCLPLVSFLYPTVQLQEPLPPEGCRSRWRRRRRSPGGPWHRARPARRAAAAGGGARPCEVSGERARASDRPSNRRRAPV